MKSWFEIKQLVETKEGILSFLNHPWEKAIGCYMVKDFEQLKTIINNLSLEEIIEFVQEEDQIVFNIVIPMWSLDQIKTLLILTQKSKKYFLLPVLAEAYGKIIHDSINHKRKYTGEPYWVHLQEVQELVKSIGGTFEMQAAAFLHDVVEDVKINPEEIKYLFGSQIASLVEMLTDVSTPSDGNRKIRKQKDLEHTAQASPEAKTIKLADLISNSISITQFDPDFAKVYMREKKALLEVLKEGDPTLYQKALEIINKFYNN